MRALGTHPDDRHLATTRYRAAMCRRLAALGLGVVWMSRAQNAHAGGQAIDDNARFPTPTPMLYPEVRVNPPTQTVRCAGSFDITITSSGGPGTTLVISSLQLWHGYSQGYYGQGFTWDVSGITPPISLPNGSSLTIPVSYRGDSSGFPSRLHLAFTSDARDQPQQFLTYFGELCRTPTPTPTAPPIPIPCVGDCNRDGVTLVNELVTMVQTALGAAPISACPSGDADGNGTIEVTEVLNAVNALLNGCAGLLCGGSEQIDCGAGFYCRFPPGTCGAGNVTGLCDVAMKRPSPCSPDVLPVCGCDGYTYPHDCELLIAGESKAHDGPCEP